MVEKEVRFREVGGQRGSRPTIQHPKQPEESIHSSTNHNKTWGHTHWFTPPQTMNTSTLNTISPIISLPSNSSIFPITCTHPTPLCQHVYLPKVKREQESEKKDNRHHLPFLCYLHAKSIRMRPQCSFYAFPRCYVRLELKWEARQFISVGSISPIIK